MPTGQLEDSKMLVLSRKRGESIVIGGGITVTVVKVQGTAVGLGIDAPKEIGVHRSELCQPKISPSFRASRNLEIA
jgi:carbon storage regulator